VRTAAAIALVAVLAAGCSSGDDDEAPEAARPRCTEVAAGETRVTLRFRGAERWYLRNAPPAPRGEGSRRLPLVVDLHGFLEGAEIHARHSDLGALGAKEGFVTVTPQGSGDPVRWDLRAGSGDVRFIGALLDHVEATTCVDPGRVFVTGLSNGGLMAARLACAYADRIAAAAPVAGVMDPPGCRPSRPVPVVDFHGTADPYLRYEGGLGEAGLDLPSPDGSGRTLRDLGPEVDRAAELGSVPDAMAAWAARNGCGDAPTERKVADDVTLVDYDCPEGADVQHYRIEGGGHTWPGSAFSKTIERITGPTTTSISANEVMWKFFEEVG
jgi:polyhydroxybutyrate depolymerase